VLSGRANATYKITGTWALQLFAFYRARQVQLQGYQGSFGMYSLSLKKDFNDKKGSVGIGAENFFTPSFKIPTVVNSPVVTQRSVSIMHNMNFKINFSYRFGKLGTEEKKAKRKKTVSNDDMKEGGESGIQNGAGGIIPASGSENGANQIQNTRRNDGGNIDKTQKTPIQK
jgi:hypothetical protein